MIIVFLLLCMLFFNIMVLIGLLIKRKNIRKDIE